MPHHSRLIERTLSFLGRFPVLMLFLALGVVMLLAFLDPGLVQGLYEQYGLIGLFLASIVANASILFPVPFDLLLFGIATLENRFSVLLLFALVSGIGAALGELTAYLIGFYGVRSLEKMQRKEFLKMREIREQLKQSGSVFVFLAALTPLPFDIVGIAAGLIKYDIRKFFLSVLAGKIVRSTLIVSAGFYGIEFLRGIYFV